jgi:hypothetical protein
MPSARLSDRAVTLFRAAGYQPGLGASTTSLGWTNALLGDYRQALANLGNRHSEALTLDSLGYAYLHLGQFDRETGDLDSAGRMRRGPGRKLAGPPERSGGRA